MRKAAVNCNRRLKPLFGVFTEEGNVDPAALTRQHYLHAALQGSLALVPSGRSKLFGVLRQHYPHRRLRAEVLSDYALHALRVVQYAPLIEVQTLLLCIVLIVLVLIAWFGGGIFVLLFCLCRDALWKSPELRGLSQKLKKNVSVDSHLTLC